MSRLAIEFASFEFSQQLADQIPWFILVEIMTKSESHKEMLWYINQTHKNGWSRCMVLNQIAMKSYERSLINPITTEAISNSNDLKEYGKGYSYEQFKKMSQFVKEFNRDEIRLQPVTQIPWSTLITIIMPKSHSHEEILCYINQTYKNGWSRFVV